MNDFHLCTLQYFRYLREYRTMILNTTYTNFSPNNDQQPLDHWKEGTVDTMTKPSMPLLSF